MATYERRIDSLGGTDTEQSEDWNDGYQRGLSDACEVAGEADEVISELVELIDDILGGYRRLSDWAHVAEVAVGRIKARTAK